MVRSHPQDGRDRLQPFHAVRSDVLQVIKDRATEGVRQRDKENERRERLQAFSRVQDIHERGGQRPLPDT